MNIMKKIFVILICIVGVFSCQKEYSLEGVFNGESDGSLKDSSGNCHEIVKVGNYLVDTSLTAGNYLVVKINFTATGKWFVYSDTVNGVWFRDSGYTTKLGTHVVQIRGFGKPILPIDADITLYYKNSICHLSLPCIPGIGVTRVYRDYFPTSHFSNWQYFSTALNDTLHAKILPSDSVINGLTYSRLELHTPITNTRDTLHYRKDGLGNYFRYYAVTTGANRDFIFLKDYEPVNTTWESPIVNINYLGFPTQAKLKFTILDRNVRVNLNSKNFDSVIRVKEEWQYLISGSFQTINNNEHWYAKNIGQINFLQFSSTSPVNINLRRWRVY
jgi:hypothetical protein